MTMAVFLVFLFDDGNVFLRVTDAEGYAAACTFVDSWL